MNDPKPQFELRFLQRRLEPKAQTLVGGLRLVAPPLSSERAPLDLVACLDVSGSMAGLKLHRAKESLKKLVEQLSAHDRLSLVTFESDAHIVLRPTEMQPTGKAEALHRIEGLAPMGMTNLSGGLAASLELLAGGTGKALRRVLLFTDGHANVGLTEGDLAGFTTLLQKAPEATCVSLFGYGEDHDGDFLASLASLGSGNYHRVADADSIRDAFAVELGGLLSVVGAEVTIRVRPLPGAGVPAFLNDFRTTNDGGAVTLHLPELFAEEERWVVFELPFAQPAALLPPEREVAEVEVAWLVPGSGERGWASLRGGIELVDRAQVDAPDPELQEQRTILQAARAQRRADELVEQGRYEDAVAVLREAGLQAERLGTKRGTVLASVMEEASRVYADPADYATSRSRMRSFQVLMSKGKPSGTRYDSHFETGTQRDMKRRFRGAPPDSDDSGGSGSGT